MIKSWRQTMAPLGLTLAALGYGLAQATLAIPAVPQAEPGSPAESPAPRPIDRQSEFWWTKEQLDAELGTSKLIVRWLPVAEAPGAATPPTVEVIVNFQVWSLLDYFGRYEFATTFGRKAEDLGYGLRIVTDRGLILGQYRCLTPPMGLKTGLPSTRQCKVQLDSPGQRGLRNRSLF